MTEERHEAWHAPALFPDEAPGSENSFQWNLGLAEPITVGGAEYSLSEPAQITAKMSRQNGSVLLILSLSCRIITPCRRCLRQVGVAIQDDFMYSFILRSDVLGEESSAGSGAGDEAVLVPVARLTGPIDLGDLAWECFICSLPPYVSCEGGCEDAVERYGSTADPRMQVFADLFKAEKEGTSNGNPEG
ncbi:MULTISPECIES: YceD family protein [Jonquetella]|uniref:Putative metal-binding protein n=1 Tax=Jonquetella anthropi DSM 22815 TaxID=885272 RepID=H0UJV6_9BACT|nr:MULTISPECIES: YceD family protein [Jonquetella]EEX48716.1 hypothetical protein GCWU000246_00742 [Jonquetella anthropi E3_33 E1]EHM12965.1 putative metal-binding protein [Jonquetella anthropi DSM 22815]ERL23489.1 hypothetical protein HMPREF1249_0497 [Jonquetella sp. BV3C21]